MVGVRGLEPPPLARLVPKTSAYTFRHTPTNYSVLYIIVFICPMRIIMNILNNKI